jgi:hypothetical protein
MVTQKRDESRTKQGCQIFLGTTYQNGNIPIGRKIYNIAIKITNIFHGKTFQNLPKIGFLVWKIYHLAPLERKYIVGTSRAIRRMSRTPSQSSDGDIVRKFVINSRYYLHTKNTNFGILWRYLEWKKVGIFYDHLVHVVAIWYILRPFGNFYSHLSSYLVYFLPFWYVTRNSRRHVGIVSASGKEEPSSNPVRV